MTYCSLGALAKIPSLYLVLPSDDSTLFDEYRGVNCVSPFRIISNQKKPLPTSRSRLRQIYRSPVISGYFRSGAADARARGRSLRAYYAARGRSPSQRTGAPLPVYKVSEGGAGRASTRFVISDFDGDSSFCLSILFRFETFPSILIFLYRLRFSLYRYSISACFISFFSVESALTCKWRILFRHSSYYLNYYRPGSLSMEKQAAPRNDYMLSRYGSSGYGS